jgi:CarboxypepD_reg-like domain/TonB-dependent Receptor Plug Domain
MKHLILLALAILFTLLLQSQQIPLTQTLRGIVTDEQSGQVLAAVSVSVDGTAPAIAGISDSKGNFRLKAVPIGRQTIRLSCTGYEEAVIQNIEFTSSKEVILEIKLREKITKLEEVVVTAGKQKNRALNESAIVSARQFTVDEAMRYSGTRNDPSRMVQNFAGVSGTNDARNDIVIRGNSPSGVLWRMDGIDIPNPNHFSTLGATGGPVSILNTNTLRNSDFLTSAFPAQYGNALAGVFDLRMRNGNNEKYEFLGQMGFNGFELGAEGPLSKQNKASFLVNYRYSLIAAIQALGLSVGTGATTPYYQDISFKIHLPTKKMGVFDWFGIGGESHVNFPADEEDNLYASNDGTLRKRNFTSLTGVTGLTHTYFFNPTASGKMTLAISGFQSKYLEQIVQQDKADKTAYDKNNRQVKFSAGYTFNKKFNAANQLTAGIVADFNTLTLKQDYIRNGDSALTTLFNTREKAVLLKGFVTLNHRFSDRLSTNLGMYYQQFTFNNSSSLEPRWNMKYQLKANQSFSLGAGLHSQTQPLEVYMYESTNSAGTKERTNQQLDLVKSLHTVIGYDINFSRQLRFKAELYAQYIYHAAVEKTASSFSMLNAGADFYFPDKINLANNGKGYNYGAELTLERFLHRRFYYLVTVSLFNSRYQGSDKVWRNTAFNTIYVSNLLAGKEFRLSQTSSFSVDTRIVLSGGKLYTPFDLPASSAAGYVVFDETKAYSERNQPYWRWDLKFSFTRNGRKATHKWFIDLQNLSNRQNLYVRTLNPRTGKVSEINQIGFFPNFNYMVTF